ncbi:hypothetical protein D3C87_1463970 [compost metagenome]
MGLKYSKIAILLQDCIIALKGAKTLCPIGEGNFSFIKKEYMRRFKKDFWFRRLVDVISYSLGLLFIYAAASKLLEYERFVVTIGQSAMLTPYTGILAWLVPVIELVLVVMLVFDKFRLPGLLASFSLMVMFTAYIFIVLYLIREQPCGCGGVLELLGWEAHMIFNIGFTVLAGVGVALQHTVISREAQRREISPMRSR